MPCTSPRALSASSFGSKATLAEGGVFSLHVICTFCTLHIVGCHVTLTSQLAAQNRSCSLTAVSIGGDLRINAQEKPRTLWDETGGPEDVKKASAAENQVVAQQKIPRGSAQKIGKLGPTIIYGPFLIKNSH